MTPSPRRRPVIGQPTSPMTMLRLILLAIISTTFLLSIWHLGTSDPITSLSLLDSAQAVQSEPGTGRDRNAFKRSRHAQQVALTAGASSREDYCSSSRARSVAERLREKEGAVVVLEHGIHDEVVGAVAHTLLRAGIKPALHYFARFSFPDILDRVAPGLTITNPHIKENVKALEVGIKEGDVEVLILTTCSGSLPNLMPLILTSPHLHVICIIHHSGPDLHHKMRKHLEPLAKEERITLLVLGDHVRREIALDLQEWAEKDEAGWWEGLGVETLLPIFDYPGQVDRIDPPVFPSRAAIQGNIETGRRNYAKILSDLRKAIIADPALWGYSKPATEGKPYEPLAGPEASPFTLHLVGQKPAGSTIEIPVELEAVVEIHQKLAYPAYYDLLSTMDVIVPAFAQASTYVETTSSSIAAAAIVRVPVLASPRHIQAYNYLDSPCVLPRNISQSEVRSLEVARRDSAMRYARRPSSEWEEFQGDILRQNVCMWEKVLGSIRASPIEPRLQT